MYKPIDIDTLKKNPSFRWWLTRDNFFTKDECNEVREYIDNNAKPKVGSYSIIEEQPMMEDDICKLNIADIVEQKYLDKVWSLIEIANTTVYKYNISGIYKNKLMGHRYDGDDWYTPHSDFHPIDPFTVVKLTIIIFLSNEGEDYQGGEFKFFDGTHIEGKEGRILILPSFYGHEVKPITNGHRYSLVTWAVGDTFV